MGSDLSARPLQNPAVSCPADTFRTQEVTVLAEPADRRSNNFAVTIQRAGYYEISTLVGYNSGNNQLNESFYLLVRSPDGTLRYPRNANLQAGDAAYFVVEDDSLPGSHLNLRTAGIFYFEKGENTIELHHYAEIAADYPEFINCPDILTGVNCRDENGRTVIAGPQSVGITVFVATFACTDLELSYRAASDTTLEIDGRAVPATTAGGVFDLQLRWENHGPFPAYDVVLQDTLPGFLAPDFAAAPPDSADGAVHVWRFPEIAVGAVESLAFTARVDSTITHLPRLLHSGAEIFAASDTLPQNNFAAVEMGVFAQSIPFDLSLQKIAAPTAVPAAGTVAYRLLLTNSGPGAAHGIVLQDTLPALLTASEFSPPPSQRANGLLRWQFDTLAAGQSLEIRYTGTAAASLPAGRVTLVNRAGVHAEGDSQPANNFASAQVVVSQSEECYLDRNVFRPGVEAPLEIHFGLGESQSVRIEIFDIAGSPIRTIADAPFSAGVHQVNWNGISSRGKPAGAGMYVITLKGEKFKCWKKLMVIR